MGCCENKQETLPLNTTSKYSMKKIEKSYLIKQSFTRVKDRYDVIKQLGIGTFSTVFLVKHKTTGDLFALKTINKENIKPEQQAAIHNEMHLLSTIVLAI